MDLKLLQVIRYGVACWTMWIGIDTAIRACSCWEAGSPGMCRTGEGARMILVYETAHVSQGKCR